MFTEWFGEWDYAVLFLTLIMLTLIFVVLVIVGGKIIMAIIRKLKELFDDTDDEFFDEDEV